MRTIIIAALLVAPAVAHAEPIAVTTNAAPVADAPRTYIAPGLAFGSAGSHTMVGGSLEIGERITDHLVVHVEGLTGSTVAFLGGSGPVYAATAGIDATSCAKLEKVCAYAGVAAGYGSTKYTEADWFDGSNAMTTSEQGATGVIRAGLDIGNKHLRWRPGFEASLFGPSQGAMTSSFALTF